MAKAVTTSTAPKANNFLYIFHCVIGLFLMFGFGMIKPIAPLTPVGMQVLGIFAGLIYLWSFVSVLWPSLLGLLALGLSDYATMPQVLFNGFGDKIPILVLFAMILFGAIQHAGVIKYISRWFLTRKIINGRPVIFSFIVIYCAYVLSALGATTLPAILFMWSVLYSVLEDVGYKKGDKYTSIMVIGTMFGAISGQAAKPFTGSALMVIAAFEKTTNIHLEYLPYMVYGFIMSSLGIVIFSLLIKFVFKPDMSKIANISTDRFEQDKLPKMTLQQKVLFTCLFGFLAIVLLPSILPQSFWLGALLNKLGAWGIVIGFVVGLCLFKIDGKPILNFKEIVGRHVSWDVYFLVVMCMAVSGGLTADATGIKPFLVQLFQPLLGGHSVYGFSVILLITALIITNIANNAVMGVLLMPIMYGFALENGTNLPALATAMVFMLHYAIMIPGASPYAAILHGNTDWVEPKEIYKYGSVIVISMLVMFLLIGLPLANMIFSA
ncbi:MAG: SLC13 family permease [Peptococcaceae bacterium]